MNRTQKTHDGSPDTRQRRMANGTISKSSPARPGPAGVYSGSARSMRTAPARFAVVCTAT